MKILVLDVGGTNVKLALQGRKMVRKLPSGPDMTPEKMITDVLEAAADWVFDHVSIGFPAPVRHGKIEREPLGNNPAHGHTSDMSLSEPTGTEKPSEVFCEKLRRIGSSRFIGFAKPPGIKTRDTMITSQFGYASVPVVQTAA